MRPFIVLCASLLFLPSAPGFSQELLALDTAINRALAHNRSLARAAIDLDTTALAVEDSRSSFATHVTPGASAGFSSGQDDWEYGLSLEKKLSPGTELEVGGTMTRSEGDDGTATERASAKIELRQPLLRNFGSLIHDEPVRDAESRLGRAQRTFEQQKDDLIINLVRTYETIIRLEKQIESDEAFFDRMHKLYRLTKAREQQGHTTRVDTLRVELQQGQAEARLQNTRQSLATSRRELAELLGEDVNTTFALEPPPILDFDIPELVSAVNIAFENRLDYAQALHDYRERIRDVRIAKRELYPDISLVSHYEQYGEGDADSKATSLDEEEWFIGLTASTDFNPVSAKIRIKSAQNTSASAWETIQITELSIARDVHQRLSAHLRARTDLEIARRNQELAANRAKLARRLFEIGRGDNFSATDAEQAYIQAEIQLLSAKAEASISAYSLLRALGTLVEHPDDLKPPAQEAQL
ncbi:MAG: TolC family protein [Verrucomicrobia bacterium]|nr:TolC family protein [Verrucomicrobiota bacterium]